MGRLIGRSRNSWRPGKSKFPSFWHPVGQTKRTIPGYEPAIGAEQQKQSRSEFVAVLIDTASKKPVTSARIILAYKKEGTSECVIDASLTGVSNERGEVRILNVVPGAYAVFYNISGILHAGLNGKVVN
jgi:hypothetical protein